MKTDRLEIFRRAEETREKLGESDNSPIDIFAVVQRIEHLSLVLYPFRDNISGMCVKAGQDAVIAVNSTMSVGRQNFSIAHELYHYYYDNSKTSTVCRKDIGKGNEVEQIADQFASFLLMPHVQRDADGYNGLVTCEDVIRLEQYYRVSHLAVLYRLLSEGCITQAQLEEFRGGVAKKAAVLGYDTALYKPSRPEKRLKTYGYYIKQAQEMLDKEIISDGKYEQLLLEAFRPDLVYGDDSEEAELDD